MKAAIYARMSTDNQSEASPEDQVSACRRYAAAHGFETPDELVFIDRAISGAVENRPALLALRAALDRFDVLLVFDGTRIARELGIFATVVRELREAGKVAYSASTGQRLDGPSETALAWVGAMTREQVQASTKRGLDDRARRRRATGAPAYGYATVDAADGSGEREYAIVPEQAEVVRRIFADYLAGCSMREVADQLNREGVPGPKPRGGAKVRTWIHTAVREILRRQLYAGVREYGAVERTRRVDGRRTARKRKASEVIRVEVPELAIVSEAVWLDVQAALLARGCSPGLRAKAAPVHVLSTLLRCGECGASFHVRGGAFACSRLRSRKPCGSTLRIRPEVIHERVLGTIGRQLLASESAGRIIARALELVRAALDRREDLGADRERLTALDRRIRHTLALAQDTADEREFHELRDQLADMREERRKLRDQVTAVEHAGEADERALRARLAAMLDDLAGTMAGDVAAARAALRAVIAEDADGQRRLDVVADPAAPDGFRVEGTLRIPVNLCATGGDPGAIRTRDPQLRRLVLYPG